MQRMSPRSWPEGFSLPDFSAPLDARELELPLPEGATVKGFFFQRALRELDARGLPHEGDRRYTMFKDYPLDAYRRLLLESAALLHPGLPRREALRRLGQLAYPALADTMIGRVIFGAFGEDIASVMKAAAKGYKVSLHPGSARVLDSGTQHARIRLDDIFVFADCYQVGVFEGAITACRRSGEVAMKRYSPSSVELHVAWD